MRGWALSGLTILFTNPSARAGYDTRSIFKRSLTGLNSDFSFSETSCLTKAEEPSLSFYLPTAGGRIIGFIPRVLVLCEIQSASSRIWTRVAVSISYNDNHYTTGTSAWRSIEVKQRNRKIAYLLKPWNDFTWNEYATFCLFKLKVFCFSLLHIELRSEIRHSWYNGYRYWKWSEFNPKMRLFAFNIALMPLGKVWIQLFFPELSANCWSDYDL